MHFHYISLNNKPLYNKSVHSTTASALNMSSLKVMPTHKLLKNEAIDRLHSVACDFPKYKTRLEKLITNFTVDDTLRFINIVDKDFDFRWSKYYKLYTAYFDEIEDLIYLFDKYNSCLVRETRI